MRDSKRGGTKHSNDVERGKMKGDTLVCRTFRFRINARCATTTMSLFSMKCKTRVIGALLHTRKRETHVIGAHLTLGPHA
jgi:hypothetical protein